MITRRTFLKTGVFGGLLLGVIAVLQKPLDRVGKRALVDAYPIAASQRMVITAVAPVLLRSALPGTGSARELALKRAVAGVEIAVASLSAATQREVAELFSLLVFPPARIALAGLREPWDQVAEDDVEAFLLKWQASPVDLLKSAYQALHDLVLGSWYADPAAWAGIGYPGPPAVFQS